MFLVAPLLTTLTLAIYVATSPVEVHTSPVTLPLAKRISTSGGVTSLLQHDEARAAMLWERGVAIQSPGELGHRRQDSIDITSTAVQYIASVGVGEPVTNYNLLVDTGSSNIWVGVGNTPYTPTNPSKDTGEPVSVSYGSKSFSGEEWLDTVTLGNGLIISQQSIGVMNKSSSSTLRPGLDGILGIGRADQTRGTLTNEPDTEIPTLVDNLCSQGTIPQNLFSVFFAPSTSVGSTNGELTFGGTDRNKYTGSISYTPITSTFPASEYWGINQTITYGDETVLSEAAGIVDTGTIFVCLTSDAYQKYQSVTGATRDEATDLLTLTPAQYANLLDLSFHIGSATFALTPNGQIWPRVLNSYIGGSSGMIYSIVSHTRRPPPQGFGFVNGLAFLERFYSVIDTANQQVGFATTPFTNAIIN